MEMISVSLALLLVTVIEGANICELRDTTNPTGDITSPEYPKIYPTNKRCSFTISVQVGNTIVVSFSDIDLEIDEDVDGDCFDFVEITDLVTKESKTYCGKKLPKDFISKSNQIRISFTSDVSHPSIANRGFRLKYRTMANIHGGQSVCPSRAFIADANGGYISSPDFPLNYGNNVNCKFTLIVPAGKKTHIEFVEMDIEYENHCIFDKLNISSSSKQYGVCGGGTGGDKPEDLEFYGSNVFFHFLTNAQNVNKGFLIKYSFLDDETSSNDCVCPSGNSYIRVDLTKKKLIRHTDDIRFEFKTTQSNSLLLYAMGRHRDFLRIKLVQGEVKFSVDLGTGKGTVIVPSGSLNDNEWHEVEIKRTGRRARVTIDRRFSGNLETPGIFTKLDLRPPNAFMFVAGSARPHHGPNFVGCLKNFIIDNRKPIVEALRGDPAHTMYFNPFRRCPAT